MANKKTQNLLTITPKKSEYIYEFIFDVVNWQKLSEALNMSKSSLFRCKDKLKEIYDEKTAFEAFAETFTIKEMNTIIELFNDYKNNPENYEKKKKKKQVDLESQKEIVNKNLAPMNMHYDENVGDKSKE